VAVLTRARRERQEAGAAPVRLVRGRARVDRSADRLAGRLRPGEIAVVDELDLDLAAARRLLGAGAVAVVNASPSLSGRLPVAGAAALLEAGVPVVDAVGAGLFGAVRDGDDLVIDLDGGRLLGGRKAQNVVAQGTVLGAGQVEEIRGAARSSLADRSAVLVRDAADLLSLAEPLLVDTGGGPSLGVRGLPVLLVGPGTEAAQDLALVRRWVADARPIVVGIGSGAAVAAAAGLPVGVVVLTDAGESRLVSGGPRQSWGGVPESVLRASAGIVVVTADPTVDAASLPGGVGELFDDLGPQLRTCHSPLPVSAAAMALVQADAPAVVVTAGLPHDLSGLLDAPRDAGAGLLLAQLRSPARCLPATTAAALLPAPRRRLVHPALIVLAVLIAALAVLAVSDPGQVLLDRWFPGWQPW
jgi:uncharacterized membrane-anchored protein